MLCLLLIGALTATPAPLHEGTAALQARLLAELDRPQAIADLFRLYERRDENGDLGSLIATLESAAKSPRGRPDVRALAAEMRAELTIAQGQLPKAAALFDEVAPIRAWSIIGPFENEGRAGLLTAYPPEKEGYDAKAVYRGKEHDVAWRALPSGHAPYGFIDLAAAIYPRSDVAVYAATVLRLGQARAALFHLGTSGASRVWLNGKLVHEDLAVHPSRFDQKTFAGELREGDNFVLVKIAHNHGRLGFSLRVADADDAPLVDLAKSAHAPKAKAAAFAAASEGSQKHPAPAHKPADALDELRKVIARVGPSDSLILIEGETGTGKERVARALHLASGRKGRFVAVNCAAIPATLLESELFGAEKGAFTGATARRIGRFEQAQKGTLLLDEIGDLPLDLQAKLLRVLEEREVTRLGGGSPVAIDVRVVAATHRDLRKAATEGRFREDLYYRLAVFPVRIAPLRQRSEDVVPLLRAFLADLRGPQAEVTITAEGEGALRAHPWPGNVRELRNFAERLHLVRDPGTLTVDAEAAALLAPAASKAPGAIAGIGTLSYRELCEEAERKILREALERSEGNVAAAARLLKVDRGNLYRRIKALGVDADDEPM